MKETVNSANRILAKGRRQRRMVAGVVCGLATVLVMLICVLAYCLKVSWEMQVGARLQISERTHDVLAEAHGEIRIVCFMNRRHAMYRPISRLLRGISNASRSVAGAQIVIEYVDPRWDLTRAGQLVGAGIPENALVFMRQRRKIIVTLDDMLTSYSTLRLQGEGLLKYNKNNSEGVFNGEAVCASAISRLALSHEKAVIYWLQGHGEVGFEDYDELRGFSNIAREIKREGFELKALSLVGIKHIPKDAHVLVIAGARFTFATEEVNLIDAFLQHGGRLLYLAMPCKITGVEALLEQWGIRLTPFIAVSPRTLSGHDVVVSTYSDHVITRNLKQAAVIFGYATCLDVITNAVIASEVSPCHPMVLAQTDDAGWGELTPEVFPRAFDLQHDLRGPVTVAAVSERGGHVAKDVVFKPTRICVIGETDFVMNGALATRANANRDLFMNALIWLAGIDSGSASSMGGDATLVIGFERRQWIIFMVLSTVVVPAGVLLGFGLWSRKKRQ